MNRQFFRWLMRHIDPHEPDKYKFKNLFFKEARHLQLRTHEADILLAAFDFAFEAHLRAPARESGEAYIFHVVRAALHMVWTQRTLGVSDIDTIVEILLHDCVEDAEESGLDPKLVQSEVQLRFGSRIAYDVHCLTKHKESGETNGAYFQRLVLCGTWRPLAGKFKDRLDNMWTIQSVSRERALRKIAETEHWFPLIANRLHTLIVLEIQAGRLDPEWLPLSKVLLGKLRRAIRVQRLRL